MRVRQVTTSGARPASGAAGVQRERPETVAQSVPQGVLGIGKRVFQAFSADNGTLMAAAVAFYLLLSLIPLVLVGLSIFGMVMGDETAQRHVFGFLQQFFPAQSSMLRDVIMAIHQQRGTIGWIGLASLAFTATSGLATLETAINVVWGVRGRSFLRSKLFSFGMMLVVATLLVLSVSITAIVGWAADIPAIAWISQNQVLRIFGLVLPWLISGLMFTLIYKYVPNASTGWRPAVIAGLITAFLWELFKVGYTFYTANWGDQRATYGALAGFVGLIVWIYYSTVLVLLGVELSWVLSGCPGGKEKHPARARAADAGGS